MREAKSSKSSDSRMNVLDECVLCALVWPENTCASMAMAMAIDVSGVVNVQTPRMDVYSENRKIKDKLIWKKKKKTRNEWKKTEKKEREK